MRMLPNLKRSNKAQMLFLIGAKQFRFQKYFNQNTSQMFRSKFILNVPFKTHTNCCRLQCFYKYSLTELTSNKYLKYFGLLAGRLVEVVAAPTCFVLFLKRHRINYKRNTKPVIIADRAVIRMINLTPRYRQAEGSSSKSGGGGTFLVNCVLGVIMVENKLK